MSVFVTVGTTSFDALVKAVDSVEVQDILLQSGYQKLTIQIGRGSYTPNKLEGIKEQSSSDEKRSSQESLESYVKVGKLDCSYYRFKPSLEDDMSGADLIISHAGAGSIMESLRLKKALIVVINEALMDNHQSELGEAMQTINVAKCTNVDNLVKVLVQNKNQPLCKSLKAYPEADYNLFPTFLDGVVFNSS
mmetsp:Transcript_13707/g.15614  ORF Transcript_13707/g.15614 Transcript_13707/m.15614 type:complete len:192 (+) Transcript_13707:144-719(+)